MKNRKPIGDQEITMSLRVISFAFKVIKFILIVFLLGLDVHFGFTSPRENYTLGYSGIFGSSYLYIVAGVLLLYFVYRILLIITKTYFGKSNGQKHKSSSVFVKEATLLMLVGLPIATGIGLTYSSKGFFIGIAFQVLRWIMALIVTVSVCFIYIEDVEFSKAE